MYISILFISLVFSQPSRLRSWVSPAVPFQYKSANLVYSMGSPVMVSGINVYVIWYGNWLSQSKLIITDFISNVGNSNWWTTTREYYYQESTTSQKINITCNVTLVKEVYDSYSSGKVLNYTWPYGFNIIQKHFENGNLEVDPNGQYVLLTDEFVDVQGFGSHFCAYHYFCNYNGVDVKFMLTPNPAFTTNCKISDSSPNNDTNADAIVNYLAHEMTETATDPTISAWIDSDYSENADICAWNFGSYSYVFTSNGNQKFNVVVGSRLFFIQQNFDWFTKTCVLSVNATKCIESLGPQTASILPSESNTLRIQATLKGNGVKSLLARIIFALCLLIQIE